MTQPIEPSMSKLDEMWVQIHFTEDSVPGIRAGKLTDESRQAILRWVNDAVIGMKDVIHVSHMCPADNVECAKFWAVVNYANHQRDILKQHGWKGDGDVQ